MKRDLRLPTSDLHCYRTIRDVGLYLADTNTQFGVDYISLVFKFEDFVKDNPKDWVNGPKDLNVHREYGHWKNSWALPIGEIGHYPIVDFWATVRGTNRTAGFVVNPSTVLFGKKSPYVARVDETMRVLRYIYEEVISQWLELPNPLECATLSRLDVTADVDNVLDKQALIRFIARHPQNARVRAKAYITRSGQWETVEARSKTNGGLCVYDKSTQLGVDGRVVRFESQMRTSNLKKFCPTLEHLDDETLRQIFWKHFGNAVEAMMMTSEGVLDGLLGDRTSSLRLVEFAGITLLERLGHFVELGSGRRAAHRRLERMGVKEVLAGCFNGTS